MEKLAKSKQVQATKHMAQFHCVLVGPAINLLNFSHGIHSERLAYIQWCLKFILQELCSMIFWWYICMFGWHLCYIALTGIVCFVMYNENRPCIFTEQFIVVLWCWANIWLLHISVCHIFDIVCRFDIYVYQCGSSLPDLCQLGMKYDCPVNHSYLIEEFSFKSWCIIWGFYIRLYINAGRSMSICMIHWWTARWL